jgi:hypothetical protein
VGLRPEVAAALGYMDADPQLVDDFDKVARILRKLMR